MDETTSSCVYCQTTSNEVPLIPLKYQERSFWICPQHLPLLIHKPDQLIDKLPGAEKFKPYTESEQ